MFADNPARHKELQATLGRLARELPAPLAGFASLHRGATAAGALAPKLKELIALAIAVAIRCEDCIAFHVHDAVKAGATRGEILEALGVAIMMGGGPASMYACHALKALDQFTTAAAPAG
ncbi:MAG TPA: carboxymuconolactone decarboxylase family protein [Xanthobacteraceae bacterium]|nr:carboxymuconolactone decarboxylase family protein [Xanthobacteraceae bacterium]